MKILRAYKTELDPTCKQVGVLLQHAGAARWAYNWGLRKKIEAYKVTGKSPSAIDLHRVANIRRDSIHKMTTSIAKSASVIVTEDLNVSGMLKNHKLARALSDASLSEIHRQLEYKSKWYGAELREADRFYPSSKRCSQCGKVREITLSDRTYCCEQCGLVIGRDLNAAFNLKFLAGSSPVLACCPESSGLDLEVQTKLLVGQEPSRKELVL